MTVTTTATSTTVTCNGVTQTWSFPFTVPDTSVCKLTYTSTGGAVTVIGAPYFTVASSYPAAGGTFTFPIPPLGAFGSGTLKFERDTLALQPISFSGQNFLYPPDVELALDNLTMALQTLLNGAAAAAVALPVPYSGLPSELTNLPVTFPFAGSPPISMVVPYPVVQATIVPANFNGSYAYSVVAATSSNVFTVAYIRSGASNTIGTVTFTSASKIGTFSISNAVNLVATDILTVTSPGSTDATLSGVGITILAQRE